MRLALDEQFTPLIAAGLRELGHDVISVHDRPALRGTPDAELLRLTAAEGRALLTNNVADFQPLAMMLAADGEPHAGIVLIADATIPRSRNTTGTFVRALDAYLRAHPADDALLDRVDWLPAAG